MVSKLSLLCSIYHMFLVPLYGVPNCHCCAPSTICSLCPCMVSNLSLLCPIYHMFLVPLIWCPNCHCFAPSTICSLCPCMMSNCHCCAPSTICSLYSCMMSNWQCRAPSTICSLCPLYGAQTVITVLHLPYVPCAPVWCPNCHCCAPSTICSLCPCMVSKLSLLFSIYHMFIVPLYGAQTLIAVLRLPFVHCALVWCPNNHCCAPSAICSLSPCMVPKLS